MRFEIIDDHRDEFPIKVMYRSLRVSPSRCYGWRKRPPSAREMANQELAEKVEVVYNENQSLRQPPHLPRTQRSG
jgi:hypothetical protein